MTAQVPVWVNVWRLGNLLLITVLIAVSAKLAWQRLRRRDGGVFPAGMAMIAVYAWLDVLNRYRGHVAWSWERSPLLSVAVVAILCGYLCGYSRIVRLRPTRRSHAAEDRPVPVMAKR